MKYLDAESYWQDEKFLKEKDSIKQFIEVNNPLDRIERYLG